MPSASSITGSRPAGAASSIRPPLRVALLTGSVPPEPCGVGDFTARLAAALIDQGVDAQLVSGPEWGLAAVPQLRRQLRTLGADLLHIQYPTTGFGSGLAPHVLSLGGIGMPVVVTLHEHSQAHPLRRLSSLAFALRSQALVFTTEGERSSYLRSAPWVGRRSVVIPIGSNIPAGPPQPGPQPVVVHFGQIRPNKGLHDFLAAAQQAQREELPWRFVVIGAVLPAFRRFAEDISRPAQDLPVEWRLDQPAAIVGEQLRQAHVAYLPFPDGASLRRGSMLAALANGLPVLTTRGGQTPPDLAAAVRFVDDPPGAVAELRRLLTLPDERPQLVQRSLAFAARLAWPRIARRHRALYRLLVARR